MLHKLAAWFKTLSLAGRVGVVLALVSVSAIANAAVSSPTVAPTKPETTSTSQKAAAIEHKTITTTEAVPFTTTTVDDSTLAKGTTKTQTQGVDGVRTHAYNVVYTNGVETDRTETSNQITTAPVTQVVANGTYIAPAQPNCPNGTYVNSAGNTVCSPYQSNSVPSGATAQCRDGSYSSSQSRSGTCSHHGGVAKWL